MRALDIPARVVTGYQGGERNPVDGYWIVRQADAHAWAEVWLADRGWVRVDPTAAIAPERIERGSRALRSASDRAPLARPAAVWRPALQPRRARQRLEPVGAVVRPRPPAAACSAALGLAFDDWRQLVGVLAAGTGAADRRRRADHAAPAPAARSGRAQLRRVLPPAGRRRRRARAARDRASRCSSASSTISTAARRPGARHRRALQRCCATASRGAGSAPRRATLALSRACVQAVNLAPARPRSPRPQSLRQPCAPRCASRHSLAGAVASRRSRALPSPADAQAPRAASQPARAARARRRATTPRATRCASSSAEWSIRHGFDASRPASRVRAARAAATQRAAPDRTATRRVQALVGGLPRALPRPAADPRGPRASGATTRRGSSARHAASACRPRSSSRSSASRRSTAASPANSACSTR